MQVLGNMRVKKKKSDNKNLIVTFYNKVSLVTISYNE